MAHRAKGAGVFGSADEAVVEWREAVGPAAEAAELSPCADGMSTRLLGPCLQTGTVANLLIGHEPHELTREYYRLRRRAHDLVGPVGAGAKTPPVDEGSARDAFPSWPPRSTRHRSAELNNPHGLIRTLSAWDRTLVPGTAWEEAPMDYEEIEILRDRHPAWRLLRAQSAPLILGFLGRHFVDENNGATPAMRLTSSLEDYLDAVNAGTEDDPRFPRSAQEYLDSWSDPESGWLRRFYPVNSDEVHYDATSELEKAYGWVEGLRSRSFVGTESRLHTVVDLLRQIVHGTETDPEARLAVLRHQREQLDQEIAAAERGDVAVLGDTAVRDRYQQFAGTARTLLSDFREVEENFRMLDRSAREKIASWDGPKGDLLADLVESRSDIGQSDQGASFQAFYDFLLSNVRQDELSDLLARVQSLASIEADRRLGTIHHDWSEAAERTQQTVRQISEQLRRFLDDQVWLENRRVLDLVRSIESAALTCRDSSPEVGLTVDVPGVPITLPFERPLYDARPAAKVDSMLDPAAEEDLDVSALFTQTFIDQTRLADNIRTVLPQRSATLLTEIIDLYPVTQGAAEVVGYLSLSDDDIFVTLDESEESIIDIEDPDRGSRRIRLPKATVSRR